MTHPMMALPGLSPVSGKHVVASFEGGLLSSDGGVLLLCEAERRLGVADRLAACIKDPRVPELVTHTLADIIRFRMLMIASGYEDGNDAQALHLDPMFTAHCQCIVAERALDLPPSQRDLCSQLLNSVQN